MRRVEGEKGATVLEIDQAEACVRIRGDWTLHALSGKAESLRTALAAVPDHLGWNLSGLGRLDSFGAVLLWRAWGGNWPEKIEIDSAHHAVIERIATTAGHASPPQRPFTVVDMIATPGYMVFHLYDHMKGLTALLGQLCLDVLLLLRHPRQWPLLEISANVFKVGVKAMPVAALVGFLIGIVLSFLSALQLRAFGADVFIVNILGLGIIRELGPVLVSVLVAGRSGSAMTAQLGVMRVTEEIDALSALGISRTVRLVLPKVLALTFAMPLLVLWTSIVALFGGMVAAWAELGMAFSFFIDTLPRVVPVVNVFIGLSKGVIFGFLIALVACHFGLRVKSNTESLSANTTASVVSAITLVILVDAVLAVVTRSIGIPR